MAQQIPCQSSNSYSCNNRRNVTSSVFCVIHPSGCVTVQYCSSKRRCFLLGPCRGYIWRKGTLPSIQKSRDSCKSAVGSWETNPPEVFTDDCHWWRHGRQRSPHFWTHKSLCGNIELIVRQLSTTMDKNMEAEGSMALEAITRQQPVKNTTDWEDLVHAAGNCRL
jgi:hypothetical protein